MLGRREPHNLDRRPGEEAPRNTAGWYCMLHVAFVLHFFLLGFGTRTKKKKVAPDGTKDETRQGAGLGLGMDLD